MNTNIIEFEDRKLNANNVLANLPPADQDQIKDWLQIYSYTATVDKINAARPEGLGLKIHYTSLRNYYLDHIQPEKLVEQQADQDQIQDLAAVSVKTPYLNAVSNRLQKRLFDLSLNPETPLKEIERLLRLVLRIENLQLKQQQLALLAASHVGRNPKSVSADSPISVRTPVATTPPPPKPAEPNIKELEAELKKLLATSRVPANNKEKQEISSFPSTTPKVILTTPNIPFPSITTAIKK